MVEAVCFAGGEPVKGDSSGPMRLLRVTNWPALLQIR